MRGFSLGLVLACSLICISNATADDLSFRLFAESPVVTDEAPLAASMFGECDPFEDVRAPLHIAMFVEQAIEPVQAPRPLAKQLLVFKSASCGQPCIDLEKKTLAALRGAKWNVGKDEKATIRTVLIEDHPELAARYGIEAVPTFVMLEHGFEVERHVGIIDQWAVGRIYNGENRRALAHR